MFASSHPPREQAPRMLLLAASLAACAGVARARDRVAEATPPAAERQAQPLVERGLEQMRTSQYAAALESFKEAYDLWPTPALEARMGFAEQGLSLWIDAERHLERALTASDDRFIAQNRKIIERALLDVRRHLGLVHVVGGPPGATVKLDGITRGLLPSAGPVRVAEGERTVEVSHPGFATERRTLVVEPGKTLVLDVQLRVPGKGGAAPATLRVAAPSGEVGSDGADPAAIPADSATTGQDALRPEALDLGAASASESSAARTELRTVAWIGAGLGVSMAVGGYLWHTGVSDRREPLTLAEVSAIGVTSLGAALALAGAEYLLFDWLFAPATDGAQVGLVAGTRF